MPVVAQRVVTRRRRTVALAVLGDAFFARHTALPDADRFAAEQRCPDAADAVRGGRLQCDPPGGHFLLDARGPLPRALDTVAIRSTLVRTRPDPRGGHDRPGLDGGEVSAERAAGSPARMDGAGQDSPGTDAPGTDFLERGDTGAAGRVIVIGASAGGVEALRAVMGGLPPQLAAPVVVVLHIPRGSPSALPEILDRSGPLRAVAAEHGQRPRDGVVYVAPSDHHVLLVDGRLHLSTGPAENGHRPAIDPLFRSAALAHRSGAVGVVLSGTRDDGAAGLAAVVSRGGVAVVQDPADAQYAAMPANALGQVPDALVRPAAGIGALLGELTRPCTVAPSGAPDVDDLLGAETRIAATGVPTTDRLPEALPSAFSCPSCHGVLFELPGGPRPRFRCRVGHAWSPSSLDEEQSRSADEALWVAVRALEEKAALVDHLADEARRRGHRLSEGGYRLRSAQARAQADQVRGLLGGIGSGAAARSVPG